ncbi:MAG: metallophosphoesterase [Hadesarchaea archaeon]|nr:metallophosphoesterase [Hadesarchaea archaeon]
MTVTPIYGKRALRVESEEQRVLVIGDLHLGITAELSDKGIELPSQIPKTKERILDLVDDEKPDRLIFLGDVKHNIPVTSWGEWRDLPDFFSELSEQVPIEILPGNHDGDIKGLVPKDVIVHDAKGITINKNKVGLLHGHAWPDPKLMKTEKIITGHNHPTMEFQDKLGTRITEPAWVKTKLIPQKLPDELKNEIDGEGPELLIIPAFNKLVGGAPINRGMPEELLGPMFKSGVIQMDEAEVYLLDGTFLGKLKNLRRFGES